MENDVQMREHDLVACHVTDPEYFVPNFNLRHLKVKQTSLDFPVTTTIRAAVQKERQNVSVSIFTPPHPFNAP